MTLADILFTQGFGTRYDCRQLALSGAISVKGIEMTDPDQDSSLPGGDGNGRFVRRRSSP